MLAAGLVAAHDALHCLLIVDQRRVRIGALIVDERGITAVRQYMIGFEFRLNV